MSEEFLIMAMLKSDGKMVFMIFLGAIITVVFLGLIADSVSTQTSILTSTNATFTSAAAVNGTVQLTGRANTTVVTVVDGANDTLVWTGNFSVNTVNAAGVPGIFLVTTDAAGAAGQNDSAIGVTYSFQPQGYLPDSSSRSVASLIVIFGALAIVVFVIVVMFQFGSIREMMNRFDRRRSR